MSLEFEVRSQNFKSKAATRIIRGNAQRVAQVLIVLMLAVYGSLHTAFAHEGEDHSKDKSKISITSTSSAPPAVVRAERNIRTSAGQFNARFERIPADPRSGETVQMAVRLAEKVEGGFGAGEPLVIGDLVVTLNVVTADGTSIANNIPATLENNFYLADFEFEQPGNYKVVFNATTADKREFAVDFPVTVTSAPTNWYFWLGASLLGLLSLAAVGAVFRQTGRSSSSGGNASQRIRRIAPFAIAALLFFAFGTLALGFITPPREQRAIINLQPSGETDAAQLPNTGLFQALNVPKESQILFGIKTAQAETRQITSGLKTTGVVRARPDQRAVVVPPVAGRIILRANLTLGAAVSRGEQIGTIEQILDVSGQTELESQRLEVAAQTREVEARRLEIRNNILALQAQQAEQRANAAQARTRLAQAERELRRSENLVEVGAVPRRRVEEANTAVRVAEQEAASAEQQIKLLDSQIQQAQLGERIFRAPNVRQPMRSFSLTAPITGVISEIRVTSGSQVETGTEILNIANLASVLLEAQVFERDLPVVRQSTRASFTSAALSGEVYKIDGREDGRLLSIGQTVNPETRTVPVIYEVKNPLQRLRENNFVEITIDTSGDQTVLAIPKQAVINEQGQTFVFVFAGGETFERRAVALGAEGSDYYEVKSGLEEGDRIVIEGVYQLRSTQPGA